MSVQRVKHLKLRPDILNPTDEKVRSTITLIGTRKNFLNRIKIERGFTEKKWEHMILKSFCIAEATTIGTKQQVT